MQTKLVRSFYNITSQHQGGVVTIGNFDGVHRGHQQLIAEVIQKAKLLQVPSVVVTFEPHAFEFFGGENVNISRLTRLREKFYALANCRVDFVVVLPFNEEFAKLSATQFITHILRDTLRVSHVVIGDDFHFGYQRQGNFSLLKTMGAELGFSVESIPTFKINDMRISSTSVRKALAEGNLQLAKLMLGHAYHLQGRVRQGDQRGRQWGFPTLNIFLHRKLTPIKGVYSVMVYDMKKDSFSSPLENKAWPGVANVGIRPTVDGTSALLEVHLLNFNKEMYGSYVKVEFCEKLRDEKRFETISLLKEQIAKDIASAHLYFQKQGML